MFAILLISSFKSSEFWIPCGLSWSLSLRSDRIRMWDDLYFPIIENTSDDNDNNYAATIYS